MHQHSLAFFQYRARAVADLTKNDILELREIFDNRKDWILKLFECEYAIIRERQRKANRLKKSTSFKRTVTKKKSKLIIKEEEQEGTED